MTFSSTLARRACVATVALGLAMGAAAPATAKTPAKDAVDCTDYGAVADAPNGFIPRDDHQIVRQDPLAKAVAEHGKGSGGGKNGGGYLSDERIQAQIDVLNAAFASSGFRFDFDVDEDVTRTNEPEWFNLVSSGSDRRYFRGSNKEIK
jgi:hypothetical protein